MMVSREKKSSGLLYFPKSLPSPKRDRLVGRLLEEEGTNYLHLRENKKTGLVDGCVRNIDRIVSAMLFLASVFF